VSGRKHPFGCTCRSHVDRPWRRSEHWTIGEVRELEQRFGLVSDEVLARRFKRTIVGIRLKAKRLGLHKRSQAFTGRDVAALFGIDAGTVGKVWVRRGLIASRRPFRQGPHDVHLIDPRAVERFIREHPEYVDVDKMPDSPYRDLAARDPWISLPEAHRRTGRDPHKIVGLILAGHVRGRRRGAHWYIPVDDVALIPPLRTRDAIEESWFRRQSLLEVRRNRRKGVELPRPPRRRCVCAIHRSSGAA
jgi:hypothetical protein